MGEAPILVDVSLGTDLGPAARTDSMDDVVDLWAVAEEIRAVFGGPPRVLLETVAVETAKRILAVFPAVSDVQLSVRKPEPEGLDAAEEVVELSLARPIGG
ncbi:MAG TPA: dihydroneopterin aldolase [Chloroflexota bacterium]|jgi:dihydroneopterin aldolase|nr:dihydroneopterin aldolase [Chloroflexota bacterium]